MEKITEIVSKVIIFLTPFTLRRALALLAILVAVAAALYLSGCHVERSCTSFATVKVDRIDTIRYESHLHKDSRDYLHSYGRP